MLHIHIILLYFYNRITYFKIISTFLTRIGVRSQTTLSFKRISHELKAGAAETLRVALNRRKNKKM